MSMASSKVSTTQHPDSKTPLKRTRSVSGSESETPPPPPDSDEEMLQQEPKDMTVEELLDEQDRPPYRFEDMKTMTFKKIGDLQQNSRKGSKYSM